MRSLSSGLVSVIVVGLAVSGGSGEADARGGGAGFGAGARGGSGHVQRGVGFGGRNASFGRRFASGNRFGRGHGFGRNRYGYGLDSLGWAYGGYGAGYGYGYGQPVDGAYDSALPTSIGIPPSPVVPPAIYVMGGPSRMKASRTTIRGRQASRTLTAQSSDAVGESGVVSGAPRIIRVTR